MTSCKSTLETCLDAAHILTNPLNMCLYHGTYIAREMLTCSTRNSLCSSLDNLCTAACT